MGNYSKLTDIEEQFSVNMNDVRSKEFKRKYMQCKLMIRRWENEFLAKNGVYPTKEDIKVSPSAKEQYKLYWKLKTQILEAEILGGGGQVEETSEGVSKEHSIRAEGNGEGKGTDSCSAGAAGGGGCTTEPERGSAKGWENQLNRTQSVAEKEKYTLLNGTVAGRLLKGSSFKKRNPRKSLPFSKKSSKSLNPEDTRSVDSFDHSSILSLYSDCSNDAADQSLDGSLFSVESDCSPNIKALIMSSASLSPFLTKPEVAEVAEAAEAAEVAEAAEAAEVAEAADTLQAEEEEKAGGAVLPVCLQVVAADSVESKPSDNLNGGWVERCRGVCQEDKEEGKSSDSGFDSMEFIQGRGSKVEESSDDDLIGDSDNELEERRACGFLSQKRKAEGSPVSEPVAPESNPGGESVPVSARPPCKKLRVEVGVGGAKGEGEEKEAKKAVVEKKTNVGRLNENYLKVNLKKKVFVRGKKTVNFSRHKKLEWKKKKKGLEEERESGGTVQCYRCGEGGHFSRDCRKAAEDKLLEEDGYESGEMPDLEEAEEMARERAKENRFGKRNVLDVERPPAEEDLLQTVEPLYSALEEGGEEEAPAEVYEALLKFGHREFRAGQLKAIMRILRGQSTLLTIATGGGKSLCYQLPAYLYASRSKCITLVISPLVSLMEDQVSGSSSFFKVGCLHSGQTQKQREGVIEDARRGKLYALLVSPEAVVSRDFSGFGKIFQQLPPIAFACIDEVHCVSHWSHNFRPSYLMICKILREKLGVTTVLGLTATATVSTISSIARELCIDPEAGVIKDVPLPENLLLTVSREEDKDRALIELLTSARFRDANAILIYCTRRDECERLAVYIRTRLQDPAAQSGRSSRSLSWSAESYHAGMAAGRRRQIQRAFMRGNLRIVVATVAFGMGINKQDIRGVIHYDMPKDLESYVQEVGRAGRDGLAAHCHLFLDAKGRDLFELRRHVHSNSVDRHVLKKLLERVFVECSCAGRGQPCSGHEVAFECSEAVQMLDIPEENIYTLLSYLELSDRNLIKVLTPVYKECRIKSYRGLKGITASAKKCVPLAFACALRSKSEKSEVLEFDVIQVANKLGWDSGVVKSQLKELEWELGGDGRRRRTGLAVEFVRLGFRVCSRGDMTPSELDEVLSGLIRRVEGQEKRCLGQIDITFSTFSHFAKGSHGRCPEAVGEGTSEELKRAIREYFATERLCSGIAKAELQVRSFDEEALAADVRSLVCSYRDNTFNGRAVARIFHGIQSPNYPASLWYNCKFWRKHIDKDFNEISRLATLEILNLRI